MKLIGLVCVRNEDWILGASLRSALRWCHEVVVVDHSSIDRTKEIIQDVTKEYPFRVHYSRWYHVKKQSFRRSRPPFDEVTVDVEDPEQTLRWDEMDMRQHSLDVGRKHGGTHFAIVDADEVVTGNQADNVRGWFEKLKPGQVLDVPLLCMRSLDRYQQDSTVWSRGALTLGFHDTPDLMWKNRGAEGYHHHGRPPKNCRPDRFQPFSEREMGGVMHLQFAHPRRLLAKHVLYRMIDHLRWPGRETPEQLNRKYDEAIDWPTSEDEQKERTREVPAEWWEGNRREHITTDGWCWQEMEIRRLIGKHGKDAFQGLDLKGLDK